MVSSSGHKTLKIESRPQELEGIRTAVSELLAGTSFDPKTRDSLLVALGEAVTNSIRHSYHNEAGHPIEVTIENTPDKVIFRIRDYGEKVDLKRIKAKEKPELPPVNPGGLGIYFMKTIMDSVEYNTAHSQGNELILTKFKKGASGENSVQKK